MYALKPEPLSLDEPFDPEMDDAEGKALLDEAMALFADNEKKFGEANFDPAEHPRHPSGSPQGGEFAPKSGTVEGKVDETHELLVTSGTNAGPGFSPEQLARRDALLHQLDDVARNWLN